MLKQNFKLENLEIVQKNNKMNEITKKNNITLEQNNNSIEYTVYSNTKSELIEFLSWYLGSSSSIINDLIKEV